MEGEKEEVEVETILILLLFAKSSKRIHTSTYPVSMKDPQLLMENIFCSNNFSEDYQGGDDMGGGEFDSGKLLFEYIPLAQVTCDAKRIL